nr:hypothetical protein [Candidatus Sigynarchaeota archaeon]
MVKTCFFDLETEHLIQEFETGRGSMDFRETQARRLKIIPKLNMAVACIISYENQSTMLYYEKGQESELINKLNEFDRIIGHNLFGFDYLVLSPHTKGNIQKELQQKTYDTFLALKDASGGMW